MVWSEGPPQQPKPALTSPGARPLSHLPGHSSPAPGGLQAHLTSHGREEPSRLQNLDSQRASVFQDGSERVQDLGTEMVRALPLGSPYESPGRARERSSMSQEPSAGPAEDSARPQGAGPPAIKTWAQRPALQGEGS